MSAFDRVYGGLKTMMLMEERFTRIDARLSGLSDEVAALARSHAELGQRVADIEGYLRAATRTPFGESLRLDKQ